MGSGSNSLINWTLTPITPGSGGLSSEANTLEGTYAWNWAQNIWADSLG
ncbi:MAG: FCSD flavin-binding domain-containing protein [Burkholderiales bacterium]